MKKILSIIMTLILAVGITACSKGGEKESEKPNTPDKPVTTDVADKDDKVDKKPVNPEVVAQEIFDKMMKEWNEKDYEGFSALYAKSVPEEYIKAQYDSDWNQLASEYEDMSIKTLFSNDNMIISVLHYYIVSGAYTNDYTYNTNNILLLFSFEDNQWKMINDSGNEFTLHDLLSEGAKAVKDENISIATLKDYNIFTGFIVPGVVQGTIKEVYLGEDGSYHLTLTFSNGMKENVNFSDINLVVKDINDKEIINLNEHPINLIVKENSSSDVSMVLPVPEGAGLLGDGISWSFNYIWD